MSWKIGQICPGFPVLGILKGVADPALHKVWPLPLNFEFQAPGLNLIRIAIDQKVILGIVLLLDEITDSVIESTGDSADR